MLILEQSSSKQMRNLRGFEHSVSKPLEAANPRFPLCGGAFLVLASLSGVFQMHTSPPGKKHEKTMPRLPGQGAAGHAGGNREG